jgi:hypothetical protein
MNALAPVGNVSAQIQPGASPPRQGGHGTVRAPTCMDDQVTRAASPNRINDGG